MPHYIRVWSSLYYVIFIFVSNFVYTQEYYFLNSSVEKNLKSGPQYLDTDMAQIVESIPVAGQGPVYRTTTNSMTTDYLEYSEHCAMKIDKLSCHFPTLFWGRWFKPISVEDK